jgi:hypothetical protein
MKPSQRFSAASPSAANIISATRAKELPSAPENARHQALMSYAWWSCDGWRPSETPLALPAFDPAGSIAERFRDADVVVLALGDVEDVLELVAECRLAPPIEGEKLGVRLRAAGLVGRDAVVERVAERVCVEREGGAIGIGHGHQPKALAQALQGRNRV